MNVIIDHLIDNRKLYFIASIIAIVAMFLKIEHPGFDSSFENLGIQENEYVDNAAYIDSTFNTKSSIYIILKPKDGNMGSVISDVDIFKKEIVQRFPEAQIKTPTDLAKLMYTQEILNKTLVKRALAKLSTIELLNDGIALDSSSFLMDVGVDKDKQAIVKQKIHDAWESVPNFENYEVHFTGLLLLEDAMNVTLENDLGYILGLLLICFALIMYFSYRSIFATAYLLGIVGISMIIGVFVYMFTNFALTFVGIMVLPVVVVLSAANAVHLLTGYFSMKEGTPEEKLKRLYRKYLLPSFLTTITTAFAFFTLMFTTTISVYTLGWVCGVTILLNFIVSFCITPFVMQFAPYRKIGEHPFSRFAAFFINRKKLFAILLIPVLFISMALLPYLGFKNNFDLFVPENTDAKSAFDRLTTDYYIQSDLNIILQGPDSITTVNTVKQLNTDFEEIEEVKTILDMTTNSVVFTPIFIPVNLSSLPSFKSKYESSNGKIQRIQLKTATPKDLVNAEDKINDILDKVPPNISLKKSSSELMYEYVNQEVASSLMKSLISSSIFLFFIFLLLTRSFLQSIIGLFVNLVPLSMIVILFVVFDLSLIHI